MNQKMLKMNRQLVEANQKVEHLEGEMQKLQDYAARLTKMPARSPDLQIITSHRVTKKNSIPRGPHEMSMFGYNPTTPAALRDDQPSRASAASLVKSLFGF